MVNETGQPARLGPRPIDLVMCEHVYSVGTWRCTKCGKRMLTEPMCFEHEAERVARLVMVGMRAQHHAGTAAAGRWQRWDELGERLLDQAFYAAMQLADALGRAKEGTP